MSDYIESLPNCIYETGDKNVDRMGNYCYNVTDDNGKVITVLIMMDSHSYDNENNSYDHFHDEWYESTVKSIVKDVNGDATKMVPSLAFFQIPFNEKYYSNGDNGFNYEIKVVNMTNKKKVLKIMFSIIAAILAVAIIIAGILFFPLMGEKHTEVWAKSDEFDISKIQTVEKNSGEDFKILMFTDTQLWANLGKNKECYEQMDALVEKTQPDLITLPGDVLSAMASRFSINNFIKHMDSYEIPWAPVYGNHDNEIPTNSLNWQSDKYMASEYCLLEKGPSNLYGCGNYVINVTENGNPVYTLFMLDNGRYTKYNDGSTKEIYMGYEQIAWYEWNVKGIEKAAGRIVPSMTFSHFAQPEFREAVEKYGVQSEDGIYTIPEEYGFGYCQYLPGTAPVKSGFVDKCKELGSTKYIFCGHDHENNASITYDGITYTYGLKTGPSPVPWNFAKETGGTLITISGENENQSVNIEHIVM